MNYVPEYVWVIVVICGIAYTLRQAHDIVYLIRDHRRREHGLQIDREWLEAEKKRKPEIRIVSANKDAEKK